MAHGVVNIVICSQLWYVGAVAALPDILVTAINRKIYEFIWVGKFEAVSRCTLTNHVNKGGLDFVNIKTKLESLRCSHLYKLAISTEANWRHLAIHWIGYQMRRYNTSFASLLIPHTEEPSEFYNKPLVTFRKLSKLNPMVELADLKARSIYRQLHAANASTAVVIDKFPQVDFLQAFKKFK